MKTIAPYKPTIVTLTTDSAWRNRIHEVVQAHGARSIVAKNAEQFRLAVDGYYPILILIDLSIAQPQDGEKATALIKRGKLLPHTRATPIIAFHEHESARQQAEQAGADATIAPIQLQRQLSQLVADHLNPPIRYVDGWDEPLPADAAKGLEEFNRGDYFEQHESLEEAWNAEQRPVRELYQGILQVGVALLQIERNNWEGAIKLFRRGLPKLRDLPPTCQGVDVAQLRSQMEQIHHEVSQLGPEKLSQFDQGRFPKIEFER